MNEIVPAQRDHYLPDGAGLLDRYLARLGLSGRPAGGVAGLRALQRAHLRTIPFENLDIHLGVPIELGVAATEKILVRRRGGFCYELNGAFAGLLQALGYDVTLLEARVYGRDGAPGRRFDHLCLLVTVDGERYLTDVGFGAFVDEPLALREGVDQRDRNGTYRTEETPDGGLDVLENGERKYRFYLKPRQLGEFAEGNAFHQSSASHFARKTVCSLVTGQGRVTLSGLELTETIGGARRETSVEPAELGSVLAERFGVVLDERAVARLAATSRQAPRHSSS